VALKVKTIGRRHSYYLAHIRECLKDAGLTSQRTRIMAPGWSKVRLYCHLLTPANYEDWTAFAGGKDVTVEIVQQAVERGRPVMPREPVKTLVFHLPVGAGDELIEALRLRGWEFEPDRRVRGGRQGQPREGDERAVRKLLRDAARGSKA
jgi:hypothetical protein